MFTYNDQKDVKYVRLTSLNILRLYRYEIPYYKASTLPDGSITINSFVPSGLIDILDVKQVLVTIPRMIESNIVWGDIEVTLTEPDYDYLDKGSIPRLVGVKLDIDDFLDLYRKHTTDDVTSAPIRPEQLFHYTVGDRSYKLLTEHDVPVAYAI